MRFLARYTLPLAALAALLVPPAGETVQAANYDCAHGPDFYRVIRVEPRDRLNIRTGPHHTTQIISSIPHDGMGVQCVGPCQKNWCQIFWQGYTGWVNMRYLGE